MRGSVAGRPDILLLQEIENGNALAVLRDRGLAGMGYACAVIVPKEGLAANVAVLSRLPVTRVHTWHVGPLDGAAVRDILEVEVAAGGRTLHLLVNHWKSRVEGTRQTEPSPTGSRRAPWCGARGRSSRPTRWPTCSSRATSTRTPMGGRRPIGAGARRW